MNQPAYPIECLHCSATATHADVGIYVRTRDGGFGRWMLASNRMFAYVCPDCATPEQRRVNPKTE
jgi:hypothetical protein